MLQRAGTNRFLFKQIQPNPVEQPGISVQSFWQTWLEYVGMLSWWQLIIFCDSESGIIFAATPATPHRNCRPLLNWQCSGSMILEWGSINGGTPIAGWFIMDNSKIKMIIWGKENYFRKPPYLDKS